MSSIGNNLPQIIEILSAITKDTERNRAIEQITKAHRDFLQDEVKSRRIKSTEIILELSRIDMALEEFEVNYEFLKQKIEVDEIEALNEYIKDIKKYRKKLTSEKKKL